MIKSLTVVVATVALGLPGVALAPAPATTDGRSVQAVAVRASSDHNPHFLVDDPAAPVRPLSAPANGDPEGVARAFLREARVGKLDSAPANSPSVLNLQPSVAGGTVVRFQRRVEGIPVMAGEFVVDVDQAGAVRAAVATDEPTKPKVTTPTVAPGRATKTATAAVAKREHVPIGNLQANPAELWIYDPTLLGEPERSEPQLVWRIEVRGRPATGVRELALVDAVSGHLVRTIDLVDGALDRRTCDANGTSNYYPCLVAEAVRVEGQSASGPTDVDAAHDHAGETYNLFAALGRDSLDGNGMTIASTVRFCDGACPFENAFWDGTQMVYGEGFAVDDVVGHELTHGVTEFTSGLIYADQSGAINESLSDIFGEFVDLGNGTGTDTPDSRWLIGEDIPGIGAIRDMKSPPTMSQPDRIGSSLYYTGSLDNGGVHTNSGVGNKFAYLLTDGDTFNGQTVSGIGVTKTSRIIYEASKLLTSGASYTDFGSALRTACSTLATAAVDGIGSGDCDQVDKAALATEMDTGASPGPTADPAPVCDAGQSQDVLWADDLANPEAGNWEASVALGTDGWSHQTESGSGRSTMFGPDPDSANDSRMKRTSGLVVPSGNTYLRFDHDYGFEGPNYDGGVVEYSVDDGAGWLDTGSLPVDSGYTGVISPSWGNPLADREAFVGSSDGWTSTLIDLSSLAGLTVLIRFRIGTDTTIAADGWYVDDVEFYSCEAATPTPTPTPTAAPAPTPAEPSAEPSAETPALSSSPPAVMRRGRSVRLATTTTTGSPVRWTSLKPKVCRVRGTTLKARRRGICRIRASLPGVGASAAQVATFRIRVR